MSEIAPTVPGKIRPGLRISIVIPSTPSDISRTMMLGSISVSRIRFQSDISTRSTLAPAVFRTRSFGSVCMPSISSSRVVRSAATTSTTFSSSASWAPRLEASRTASSAQSPLRPWVSASSRA